MRIVYWDRVKTEVLLDWYHEISSCPKMCVTEDSSRLVGLVLRPQKVMVFRIFLNISLIICIYITVMTLAYFPNYIRVRQLYISDFSSFLGWIYPQVLEYRFKKLFPLIFIVWINDFMIFRNV